MVTVRLERKSRRLPSYHSPGLTLGRSPQNYAIVIAGAMPASLGGHRESHLLLCRLHGCWRLRSLFAWAFHRVRMGFICEPRRLSRPLFSFSVAVLGARRVGYQTKISAAGRVADPRPPPSRPATDDVFAVLPRRLNCNASSTCCAQFHRVVPVAGLAVFPGEQFGPCTPRCADRLGRDACAPDQDRSSPRLFQHPPPRVRDPHARNLMLAPTGDLVLGGAVASPPRTSSTISAVAKPFARKIALVQPSAPQPSSSWSARTRSGLTVLRRWRR
jgi:hypothetical protein